MSNDVLAFTVPFEQEIKNFLTEYQIPFEEHCESFTKLDFCYTATKSNFQFHFDVKEKRQRYAADNWPMNGKKEENVFILDDLGARKTVKFAPNSGIIIRDTLHKRYIFFSVVDLFLIPKIRVNRNINRNQPELKGKWLIDLRHGVSCDTLEKTFLAVKNYVLSQDEIFNKYLACYGIYVEENISGGGITRIAEHWDKDVYSTRSK